MLYGENMAFTIIICAVTALFVMLSVLIKPEFSLGKLKLGTYWVVAFIGAVLLLVTGCLPFRELIGGLTQNTSVNPLKILVLFFSMTSLSVYLDVLGFFRFLANAVLKRAGHNQKTLFLFLYLTVSILTVFTSNDIIILTFTPFICFFAKKAKISPLPYLIAEFVAANTWSMALIIGNPTNIYLASSAGVDFMQYLKVMLLPTIVAGVISFVVLYALFHNKLRESITPNVSDEPVRDKILLVVGILHLALCTILLTVSSYINLDMWIISLCFAVSLFASTAVICLVRRKPISLLYRTFARLPFELIPFVISMFTIVLSLDYTGATSIIASLFTDDFAALSFGVTSFISANIINNIPMSVLFSSVLDKTSLSGAGYMQGLYSCIAGSNIGAYLTPVGALAGIMWSSILKRYGVDLSFKKFVKYGTIVATPTLLSVLIVLSVVL